MVVTMKKLSEDEKIRMQCEAREDYERCLFTEYNAGKREGIEIERKNTEKERKNTEKERRRADELEAEVKRLRAMLKNQVLKKINVIKNPASIAYGIFGLGCYKNSEQLIGESNP